MPNCWWAPACVSGQQERRRQLRNDHPSGRADTGAEDHGYTLTDAWRLNVGSRGGDSGGPVYQELPNGEARAAGLISAGVPNHYMLFTSIGHILQDLDASLFTKGQQ